MASATQLPGPMEFSSSSTRSLNPATLEQKSAQFALGTTTLLFLWPSLTLAVANNWGGPDSADKREWFASETISQLEQNSDVDAEWIETWLLQVMFDEFDVNVEDDSAWDVALSIVRLRTECGRGDFAGVGRLRERWAAKGGESLVGLVEGEEQGDTDGSEDEDGEGDVDMDEAPQLARVMKRVEPEVDEDGFTKVTKKKR